MAFQFIPLKPRKNMRLMLSRPSRLSSFNATMRGEVASAPDPAAAGGGETACAS